MFLALSFARSLRRNFLKAPLIFALSILLGCHAFGAGTDTLPAGVRSASIRMGSIDGIDQTYGDDGKLYVLGEKKSITFDARMLERVSPQAQALIRALNSIGTYGLGSQVHLGTLRVDTRPEVQYTAPVLAYGVSDHWTVGIGLPMVKYRNQIKLSQEGSNLDFYRQQFSSIADQLGDAANINLVAEAQKTLAAKGYKTIENRDESFMGDAQVVVMHGFKLGNLAAMHSMAVTLPTGPAYDPDDLVAINTFGRTALENSLAVALPLGSRVTMLPYTSLLLPIPDRVAMRVPKDDQDTLPDEDQKQFVTRTMGPTFTVGSEIELVAGRDVSLKAGYEALWKAEDRYTDGYGRTDLLSQNTNSQAQRVKAQATYSTVNAFKKGLIPIPGMVTGEISDTVAGINIERQLRAEMSLMLFF